MRSASWFMTLAMLLGAADPGNVDGKNDVDPLQGSWTMFLCFVNGEELAADQIKSGELVVEDNEYRPKLEARRAWRGDDHQGRLIQDSSLDRFHLRGRAAKRSDGEGHLQDRTGRPDHLPGSYRPVETPHRICGPC